MKKETLNLKTSNIRDFKSGDTIYIRDMRGFNKPYVLCSFIRFHKNRVSGTVLEIDKDNPHSHSEGVGGTISADLKNCALWGKSRTMNHATMHAFNAAGYAYTESEDSDDQTASIVEHESFGVVSISRYQNSHDVSLFGSSIKHMHTIGLSISKSKEYKEGARDRVHSGETLIHIEMSQTQFAEMITSAGIGGGTPCTIRRFGGKLMEKVPFVDKRADYEREFKSKCKQTLRKTNDLEDIVKKLFEKPSVNKSDREMVTDAIHSIKMQIESNMPYIATEFNEQMDRTVKEAKGEIEAFFESKLQRLGLEAYKSEIMTLIAGEQLSDVKEIEE